MNNTTYPQNYRIFLRTETGDRNYDAGVDNQDVIGEFESDKVIVISVNDGCSGADYPVEAARLNAKVAESLVKNKNDLSFAFKASEKKFKQVLSNRYLEAIERMSLPLEETCATTAFIIIDKSTGAFVAYNCGDSGVISVDIRNRFTPLLLPQNGPRKSLTSFTNDPWSVRHGNLVRGRIGADKAGFIIYTDGADKCVENKQLMAKLVTAARKGEDAYREVENEILSMLAGKTSDDISLGVVVRPDLFDINKNMEQKENINNENAKAPVKGSEAVSERTIEYNRSRSEKLEYDIFSEISDTIVYSADKPREHKKQTSDIPVHEETVVVSRVKARTESNLLQFLDTFRSVDEIVASGLLNDDEAIKTLLMLYKIGAVACVNSKFKRR